MNYKIFNKIENMLHISPKLLQNPETLRQAIRGTFAVDVEDVSYTHIGELVDKIDNDFIVNHGCIPPGYFWCEYFKGIHYSIDYRSTTSPAGSLFRWEPFHAMMGKNTEKDLTRFNSWTSIEPPKMLLPDFINKIMDVDHLNIECIDDKIIEIHLRTGNDILHDMPLGTKAIPIWSDEKNDKKELEKEGYKFKSNLHPDSFNYGADGHLKYVREGYMVK